MHKPLYPPGHKRAGTPKADKDLTPEEQASMRAQQRAFDLRVRRRHLQNLNPVLEAERYFDKDLQAQ